MSRAARRVLARGAHLLAGCGGPIRVAPGRKGRLWPILSWRAKNRRPVGLGGAAEGQDAATVKPPRGISTGGEQAGECLWPLLLSTHCCSKQDARSPALSRRNASAWAPVGAPACKKRARLMAADAPVILAAHCSLLAASPHRRRQSAGPNWARRQVPGRKEAGAPPPPTQATWLGGDAANFRRHYEATLGA